MTLHHHSRDSGLKSLPHTAPQPERLGASPSSRGQRTRPFAASLLDFQGDGLGYRIIRRVLDITVSSCVLILASPLMGVIAALITLDSPGPVLFKHSRAGVNRRKSDRGEHRGVERRTTDLFGRPFVLYKFRTMYADAKDRFPELYTYRYSPEELASLPIKLLVSTKVAPAKFNGAWALADGDIDDPRITRLGRWLRKTSLDELPNFINVLRGDMHLVGPRPDIAENIRQYPEPHLRKLDVKQGITGLAQIKGRGRLSFLQTNEYDLEYVHRRSLRLDVKILLATIAATVKRDGAF